MLLTIHVGSARVVSGVRLGGKRAAVACASGHAPAGACDRVAVAVDVVGLQRARPGGRPSVRPGGRREWRGPAILGAEPEILIVGIDEATLDRAGVPIALVHGVLGRALEAISSAGA